MVSEQLEDSLRSEIETFIDGRLNAAKQEITELQSQLNESMNQLLDRQSEVHLDGSLASSILEHLRSAYEEGIDFAATESARAKASSDMAIVKAAITELDEQRSQAEILKALVNRAAAFAPRVAFFVVKGEQISGWRARGFEGTVGDNAIQNINFALSAETVIGEVVNSGTTWSGGANAHAEDHLILNRLGEEPPQRVVAVPLAVRGRVVAVLYADSAGLDSEAINLEAVETLVRTSAMAVELLATRTGQAKRPTAAVAPSANVPVTPQVAPAEPEQVPASEEQTEEPTEQVSASPTFTEAEPAYSAPPTTAESSSQQFERVTDSDETYVEPSSTAVPAEPLPAGGSRRWYNMDVALPVEVAGEDERKIHVDARRFARLLVSEIKLYNEQKVIEGRSQRDLYERLREYIDRSREMYDKRVKPEVSKKFDYFHNELVNTLAEGDIEKLGEAYPGATVSA